MRNNLGVLLFGIVFLALTIWLIVDRDYALAAFTLFVGLTLTFGSLIDTWTQRK